MIIISDYYINFHEEQVKKKKREIDLLFFCISLDKAPSTSSGTCARSLVRSGRRISCTWPPAPSRSTLRSARSDRRAGPYELRRRRLPSRRSKASRRGDRSRIFLCRSLCINTGRKKKYEFIFVEKNDGRE